MSRIETGHEVTKDVAVVGAQEVRFVADDGRTMFEVGWNADGRSINVRGVGCSRVDAKLYAGTIDIRPICGNAVRIMAREYDNQ